MAWVGDSPIRHSLEGICIIGTPRMGSCARDHRWMGRPGLDWAPMVKTPGVVRIAAVGDIHLGRAAYGPPIQTVLGPVAELADVLALCGDLTDRGDPEEGRQLARVLASVGVPIVAVLGNHDYESGKVPELSRILCEAGVQVLDGGDAVEI